jgi:hypothetical protein
MAMKKTSTKVMKKTSTTISKTSWADVVKGKEGGVCPTEQKKKFNAKAAEFVPRKKAACAPGTFKFNAGAPEFSAPQLELNPLAQEFVPPVSQGFNPASNEFIPPEHKLMNKATEMQRLLLECYTDDEFSTDDEVSSDDEPPTMQKRKPMTKKENTAVLPFRPPPGLAPPAAALNPHVPAFDPSTCVVPSAGTNAINFAGFFSDDEEDTPRVFSKMDNISVHDSTSAGESSDSDTESWSGPHSP